MSVVDVLSQLESELSSFGKEDIIPDEFIALAKHPKVKPFIGAELDFSNPQTEVGQLLVKCIGLLRQLNNNSSVMFKCRKGDAYRGFGIDNNVIKIYDTSTFQRKQA